MTFRREIQVDMQDDCGNQMGWRGLGSVGREGKEVGERWVAPESESAGHLRPEKDMTDVTAYRFKLHNA